MNGLSNAFGVHRLVRPLPRVLLSIGVISACNSLPEPSRISLVERFGSASIANRFVPGEPPPPTQWRFDGDGSSTGAFRAIHGITGLSVSEARLVGRATELPIMAVATPVDLDRNDRLHAVEIRMRASAGTKLGVNFAGNEELDVEETITGAKQSPLQALVTDLLPGDEFQTYTLTSANASFLASFPLSMIRHILIFPTDEKDAEFAIESVRLISTKEHLGSIESGVGWQGLGDVFREALVARSPETITFEVDLPSNPYLELVIGTVEEGAVTFHVDLDGKRVLERTVSTPDRWESAPIALEALAGRHASITLTLEAEQPGAIGFWGTPVIRNRGGSSPLGKSSVARDAVLGRDEPPPQGVILVIADTLRRDHFQPNGYGRANAPVLTALAQNGVVFLDAISQGTWTKVSVPSILTSLYPGTHGLVDMPDRLPVSVDTIAEIYRDAGYATFATSSVPFAGKLSNLHQGVDVLHERSSLEDVPLNYAKTARTFVDRLLPWIEEHRDVPFFVFLHVFDPHSPFEPYRPYDTLFMAPEELSEHRENIEKVRGVIDHLFRKDEVLPTPAELEQSGVDRETFVSHEKDWYDASIRAMDVEVGRLLERIDELGLVERTLVAFISDHGEEFLEHGRHFHGYSAYGEMLNVPLLLSWPGHLPSGLTVAETIQSIDLMPTLLDLSRLPAPAESQGQSLLPLLLSGGSLQELGWRQRPAFAERVFAPGAFDDDERKLDSYVIVSDGWKLIRNTARPEGWPEYELFDHLADPLNFENLAAANPEVVSRLTEQLEAWRKATLAARVEEDSEIEGLSAEELQRLRSLGYVQ